MTRFGTFIGALVFVIGSSASAAIPIPADKDHVVSLDGTWRFKLEQVKSPAGFRGDRKPLPPDYPATFEPFFKTDYQENAADRHDLAVPGNWEMAGFSPATYNNPDNTSGFYRVWFDVPKSWADGMVMVNFAGVQNGCQIWCNGQPVKVD